VVFYKAPPAGQANLSHYAGMQFFGEVNSERKTGVMTVDLKDINGDTVFSKKLQAEDHEADWHRHVDRHHRD
jgi:alkaline phosphatase D